MNPPVSQDLDFEGRIPFAALGEGMFGILVNSSGVNALWLHYKCHGGEMKEKVSDNVES
jgi:hypothetical protein